MTLDFDLLFHNPNPFIDDYLHGDHTHTDEDGNEVVSPGTPDRPVVIEPEPEPDPDPPNANPGPAPAPEPTDEPLTLTGGAGNEVLRGGDNDDTLRGNWINGAGSYDVLIGGPGDDHLARGIIMDGGPGDDTLVRSEDGPWGEVIMIGGPGRDVFDVRHFGKIGGVRIVDFQDGVDRILFGDHNEGRSIAYHMARGAGLTWDMQWMVNELENGVEIPQQQGRDAFGNLTILGVEPENLQFETVGDDVFLI